MKILLVNHFPLEGSGSGVYTKNIAKSLTKRGNEVCIIMPENTKNYNLVEGVKLHPIYFTWKEKIEGALPFNFPCFTTHPRSTTNFYDLNSSELEMYEETFRKAIKQEIEEFKPDVIHGQHIWILSSIASEFNIPLVVTAHGTDIMGYQKDDRFRDYADKVVNKCKKIITISKDNDELVLNTFKNVGEKNIIIKNGYDPEVFYREKYDKEVILKELGISENYEKIVSFVGKLTNFKGVDILLKACKIYENKNILTLIAGNGELFEELNKLKRELNLKNVVFLGNKPHETLRKIYNIADVSIVPSRREPFGLVALEAMACGTPVIGTNQGGIPDFLKEDVGILVEVENVEQLANAVSDILNEEKMFDREYIAKYVKENHSQDVLTNELIDVYEQALNN
ncbi:MAG: glycosyltransferase family 4 protein [Clostridia bacterium]